MRLARLLGVALSVWLCFGAVARAADPDDTLRRRIETRYHAAWSQLDRDVGRLAEALEGIVEAGPSDRFHRLRVGVEALANPGITALLFNADGEVVAWHGDGLLHEPDGWALPERGRLWRRGVTAVTMMTVDAPRGAEAWRVVLGRSLPATPFPFADLAAPVRWSLAEPIDTDTVSDGWRVGVDDGPDLVLASAPRAAGGGRFIERLPWPDTTWWRHATLGAVLLALLLGVPQRQRKGVDWQPRVVAALGLALAGAATHDYPIAGVAFGVASLGVGGWALASAHGPPRRATAALLAALIAASLGQTVDRIVLRHQIESFYLPRVAPPTLDELNDLLVELQAAFEGRELSTVLPPGAGPLDLGDLAFALWRDSPLPRRDALSALVLETPDGESSFSFGLALRDGVVPPSEPARWAMPPSAAWREALVQGAARLHRNGEPWAVARYWCLPRPGFRLAGDETGELERNLVRGKPRHETADGLPPDVRYGLYELDGQALTSPWDEAPPLPSTALSADGPSRVATPRGPARLWLRRGLDGIEALFLPVLDPREALERVGLLAALLLPALLLPAAVAVWSASGGRPWDAVRTAWRSYSRRLLIVYAALLLVPLVALNLVLLRSVAERERDEQVVAARDAMATARKLLADYLEGRDPGFLFTTVVHRELLEWISGLVGHQINLYWGSQLFVSSQQELFTAGLIPRRIPGEIYDRLTHQGYDLGFRRQSGPSRYGAAESATDRAREPGHPDGVEEREDHDGDLAYLEIYAPFDAAGAPSGQQGLFLSVPLLEQEEEAERQLSALRRRALLVTTALALILLAVGDRLTRRFARPIVELIDGTRRIARGEPLPPLTARDTELASLASAIGVMADQVAESRGNLVREKRFVERVVSHITSAVVSLDESGRVVFQNTLAAERLGTLVGRSIDSSLEGEPYAPLRSFLAEARASSTKRPVSRQVKVRSPGDSPGDSPTVEEWSVTWVPITGDGDPSVAPVVLLVIDNVTEVLRGQRLEAWAEMARIIAHEIKNPLTPIQLSAEHLVQVWRVDPERMGEVLDRCSRTILSNVEELRDIASEFSIYSRIPAAELRTGDVAAMVQELAASYFAAEASRGVGITCRADEPVMARFDAKLLGRAVRNLLENALRAAEPSAGSVELTVAREGGRESGRATIDVSDSGPGVDPKKLERIFEPYFSTYDTGTGLGLAITRRIVEQHGGEIEARNRPGGGLTVMIKLPTADTQVNASAPELAD